MRKILLVTALFVSALSASAQTEKGTALVSGTLSFETEKSKADGAEASSSFSIIPSAGYFIMNDIAVGTGIGYSSAKTAGGSKSEGIVINPVGRYYVTLADQFRFFGQLSVPVNFDSNKNADSDKTGYSTSIGAALAPGFAFFPTKRVAIEFAFSGIAFETSSAKDADDKKIDGSGSNTFSVGANFFAPNIGVAFHF